MVILTGGAGFIGANLLRRLNRMGFTEILIVDNIAKSRKWANLVGCSFANYIHKDSLWQWLGENCGTRFEMVIHLGACTDTMEVDFEYLIKNNTTYSQRLWDFCYRQGIPFIYASSAATYGDGGEGFSDAHETVARYRPINGYGYSKHLFDLWALQQKNAPPRWYGLKFFNVYGPYENHKGKMASVAYHSLPQALNNGCIRLFKSYREGCPNGGQKRDFVYVEDVVRMILFLIKNPVPNGIYNCGSGEARTFNDLAGAIFGALNRYTKIEYFDMPETIRSSYQYFTEADMSKIQSAGYDYQPTPLDKGIQKYVQWMLEKPPNKIRNPN
jgi:ADP-L-glycero-D-manno-heptose 6-epimerase